MKPRTYRLDITSRGAASHQQLPNAQVPPRLILTFILAFAVAFGSGCATNKVQTERLVTESLPRPQQILVYDFAASPTEVPADSTIAREFSVDPSTQTAEQSAVSQDLGFRIAARLVTHLQAAGLPARMVAIGATPPSTSTNDILIRGSLLSVKEGSATKRVVIGFGSGASELHAAVEVFQVTPEGLRKVESSTGRFGGNKRPGTSSGVAGLAALGNPAGLIISSGVGLYGEVRGSSRIAARADTAAKEIAKILEERARNHGWIN